MNTDRLLRLWGKTKPESKDASEFHPALFHMLDVGHVAQILIGEGVSSRWQKILGNVMGAPPNSLAGWLPWLVALHDIGKISAPFQDNSDSQLDRLKSEGFSFGDKRWNNEPHHGAVSQLFFNYELELPLLEGLRQVCREMAAGHHGIFSAPGYLADTRNILKKYEPPGFIEWRRLSANILQKILLNNKPDPWPEQSNVSSAIMALTGFTILCDWLGSDGLKFPVTSNLSFDEYIPISAERAYLAVEAAGFFQPNVSSAPAFFSGLFPDKYPPRPLQSAIDHIPVEILSQPCLAVIEAPTGEGKTEAALALAHRIAECSGTDELYYALPTTATSNQMFGRLQKYLQQNLGLATQAKLIHGQAFLYEDDLRMQPLTNGNGDDSKTNLEWFSSKKRAMLAPFGVGTIDQAELAALNVKHTALRMIGLAGKVVIVDEVHAYDTYMTTIIERLLNWLASLGTSVILLSATLPKERRARLAEAYGVLLGSDLQQDDAYPSIWVVNSQQGYHASPDAQQVDRKIRLDTISLHYGDDQAEEKAQWLLNAVNDSGCACWITNTVARAQQLFEAVDRIAPPDIDRMLLHAQFPLDERQELEKQITNKFGPGNTFRPNQGIVIGTQVLEQSLDLDFDVMVSDLAPVDLLLQRAGRLHRHSRHRSPMHAIPRLCINTALNADGTINLGVDKYVYDEFILRQTWLVLSGRGEINLPADYRPLIETVYGESEPDVNSGLRDAWIDLHQKQKKAVDAANQRLLPKPNPVDPFTGLAARLVFEENENAAGWIVAQTRLGEKSINVIPLIREGDTVWLEVDGDKLRIDLNAEIPRWLIYKLLRRSIRVSRSNAVDALEAATAVEHLPRAFANEILLKNCLPLWLTDGKISLSAGTKRVDLTLDPKLGLIIHVAKGK